MTIIIMTIAIDMMTTIMTTIMTKMVSGGAGEIIVFPSFSAFGKIAEL